MLSKEQQSSTEKNNNDISLLFLIKLGHLDGQTVFLKKLKFKI